MTQGLSGLCVGFPASFCLSLRSEFIEKYVSKEVKARLIRLFADYHPDVVSMLKKCDKNLLYKADFSVIEGVGPYYRDRVCLLGDAAHGMPPNMGQGASLALEDAYTLAELINEVGEVNPKIFNSYSLQRQRRVKRFVRMASCMNQLFQPTQRWAWNLRNVAARLYPDILSQAMMSRMYRIPAILFF